MEGSLAVKATQHDPGFFHLHNKNQKLGYILYTIQTGSIV